ncbi:MAG TPA: FAD-dependent monooxygenase [Solirubrobacterales bacterium]|jgi:2-polyprenyl-6-methoxyphenol hydroxylase-like FAD-dependent oxidoreductase|nr:FAD-dependent monooxygenase [Solirubrobacterales bacterium]
MARRAIVVGAGIGGLAAARVLRDAEFEVRVFERAADLRPEGAGVSLWPNAVRVLRGLDLAEKLPSAGVFSADSGLRRWDGRLLAPTDPAEVERRYGAPMLLLQRTTLHEALLADGVGGLIKTGAEAVRVSESDAQAKVELRGGEAFEADLLIGADGVHSKVRAGLLNDGPPRPSGLLAYRAIVDSPPLEIGLGEYWGAGRVFGLVPVDGGRLYWFATRRASPGEPPEPDPIPGLLERHRGWAPEIGAVVEATPPVEVMRHDLLDRRPSLRWVGTRTALLGDAAHPMLPFLGQGACQALEDAQALGQSLRGAADVAAALRDYEARRRRRVARIVVGSRLMGQLAHLRAAPLRALRDRGLALTPEAVRMRQLDSIVGRP